MLKDVHIGSISAIAFFLFTIYGLGCLATLFLKKRDTEKMIYRLGTGLATFPVLGVLLNTVHVPLTWHAFLVLALVGIILDFRRQPVFLGWLRARPSIQPQTGVLLAIFLVSWMIYSGGPFQYPWLEDDDSWQHAASIKFITSELSLNAPSGLFQYLNPYPPGYDLILGVLHQISPSMTWTLKFFNGFIIALGIPFFYIFTYTFTRCSFRSLIATLFLAMIPCYLSHFIWAHALVVTLFFPAFTGILNLRDDRRFLLPTVVSIAGILLVQPTQSLKFLILILLLVAPFSFDLKYARRVALAVCFALILSLLWWGPVTRSILDRSLQFKMRTNTADLRSPDKATGFMKKLFNPAGGTATRAYHLSDYLFIPDANMINNPLGVGIQLMMLAGIGLLLSIKRMFRNDRQVRAQATVFCLWFAFTFLGMNSVTFHLPVGLVAFRFWMLFAVVIALLAAEGLYAFHCFITRENIRRTFVAIWILSILMTSGWKKVDLNTAVWPPGVGWTSRQEMDDYCWLRKNLPTDTRVFAFVDNYFVMGFDMMADVWTDQYRADFARAFDLPCQQLHQALRRNGFQYLIVGQREINQLGEDLVKNKVRELNACGYFRLTSGNPDGALIYKIL